VGRGEERCGMRERDKESRGEWNRDERRGEISIREDESRGDNNRNAHCTATVTQELGN
jgi:hypothetical protein